MGGVRARASGVGSGHSLSHEEAAHSDGCKELRCHEPEDLAQEAVTDRRLRRVGRRVEVIEIGELSLLLRP